MNLKLLVMPLENQEKQLKHYFHNCVTSSKLETVMLNLLNVSKQDSSDSELAKQF